MGWRHFLGGFREQLKCRKQNIFFSLVLQSWLFSFFSPHIYTRSRVSLLGKIILNLVRGWNLHVVVELVGVHREAEVGSPRAVLRLRPGKLLPSPFAVLLLSFPPPVPPLFGTLGAELGGVWWAFCASCPDGGLAFLGSCYGRRRLGEAVAGEWRDSGFKFGMYQEISRNTCY